MENTKTMNYVSLELHLPPSKLSLTIYDLCLSNIYAMLLWRNIWATSMKGDIKTLLGRLPSLYAHYTPIILEASEARASNKYISCQTRNNVGRWVSKIFEYYQSIKNTSMIIFKIAIYQQLPITPSMCIWRTREREKERERVAMDCDMSKCCEQLEAGAQLPSLMDTYQELSKLIWVSIGYTPLQTNADAAVRICFMDKLAFHLGISGYPTAVERGY